MKFRSENNSLKNLRITDQFRMNPDDTTLTIDDIDKVFF